MNSNRIKVTLYNRTFKEIDMSDFTRITEGLFSNRDDIVAVSFPEGVETIASNAFENCRRLEKVEFPDSLKSIECEAFINCTSLKEADYGKNVTDLMNKYKLGIDIGSTTVKIALLDNNNNIVFSDYERHFANIQETLQLLPLKNFILR